MLVSHDYKFIFLKTEKTAGSSVEAYFEPFCRPDSKVSTCGPQNVLVSENGIVGYRGPYAWKRRFYSHMSAIEVRQRVERKVWDNYLKFTIVRNPYHKLVSYFHHLWHLFDSEQWFDLPDYRRKIHNIIWRAQTFGVDDVVGKFRQWLYSEYLLDKLPMYPGFVVDRDKYMINGDLVVDEIIRQESIVGGIELICHKTGVPFDEGSIPRLKSHMRKKNITASEYYDDVSKSIVRDRYLYEIEMFGYTI